MCEYFMRFNQTHWGPGFSCTCAFPCIQTTYIFFDISTAKIALKYPNSYRIEINLFEPMEIFVFEGAKLLNTKNKHL